MSQKPTVGIIGAGWYGCHIALSLQKEGYNVTILEKNPQIFSGISGNFGIRLHRGPHYPRSAATRETCRDGFEKFVNAYPDLLIHHDRAVYAHGIVDALGNPSKVSQEVFHDVCHESKDCKTVDPHTAEFAGVMSAYELDEPSVVVGSRLRSFFEGLLKEAGIPVLLNTEVLEIVNCGSFSRVKLPSTNMDFDAVVNATSFQCLLPTDILPQLPVDIGITYQSTIGVIYEDKTPQEKPFSFIVMDGWFPCIMPLVSNPNTPYTEYIVIHGCYTILGSFDDPHDAEDHLSRLDDSIMESKIKPHIDRELERFWPGFHDRFVYKTYKKSVLAKLKTASEFRSSLTFEKDGVVFVFPGKINNIFTAAEYAVLLVKNAVAQRKGFSALPVDGVARTPDGVTYTVDGAFSIAAKEIKDKPAPGESHTSNLQTFASLL